MATKNFRSTVLEPTSEFAHGDKLRFTALATVGEVLKGSFSETTIGEDGVYSVDLQYGKHRIDYKPYEGVWRHFSDVEVNADTLATTLQDLALASVPVTDETILVLQSILADAEAAKTESSAMRDEAVASAAAAAEDAAKLADVTAESIGAVSNVSGLFIKPNGGDYINSVEYHAAFKIAFSAMPQKFAVHARFLGRFTSHNSDLIIHGSIDSAGIWQALSFVRLGGTTELSINGCNDVSGQYFLVLNLGSPISNYELDVLTIQGTENNLSITSSVADDTPLDQIKITSHGDAAIDEESVREMTYENKVYKNVHKDQVDALRIPVADFDAALAEQQAGDLFKSEKSIALQIFADFNLGTGEHEITGSDIADVRAYIQSIDPAKGLKAGHLQRAKIPRPSIFDRYS